jgi:hypothetical protein
VVEALPVTWSAAIVAPVETERLVVDALVSDDEAAVKFVVEALVEESVAIEPFVKLSPVPERKVVDALTALSCDT